jgi:glutaminase
MQQLVDRIAAEARPTAAGGRVAQYIPALARVDPEQFGLAVIMADGETFVSGDADTPFSIQSISKLFTLALAMEWASEGLWDRVKREPSGMRFNSLILLEQERGVPRNPFINAGAIIIADALLNRHPRIEMSFRTQMRHLSGDKTVQYDNEVHRSEMETGDLNRAIAYALRSYGNLRQDPMEVTNAYFHFCSLAMSARSVARSALFLLGPQRGEGACATGANRQRLRAIMRTCGLYDQSGEFAYTVGLPAKSGADGGILAVNPAKGYVACAWSSPLDEFGNSVAATRALELLAEATGV